MGTTGSKRQLKGLPVIAAVCLTTALGLGQDQATPASQLEWVVAKWRFAPLWSVESRSVANGRWDVRPALDRPRNATDPAFRKALRAGTSNSGVGFFDLNRSAANGPTLPMHSGGWA